MYVYMFRILSVRPYPGLHGCPVIINVWRQNLSRTDGFLWFSRLRCGWGLEFAGAEEFFGGEVALSNLGLVFANFFWYTVWEWVILGLTTLWGGCIPRKRDIDLIGGFLKWGYPQIIHFSRMFHYKPSSHWGAPIYGNLPWWETAPCITHGYEERHLRAPTRGISDGMWPSVIDPEYCGREEFSDEKSWICSVRVWIFTVHHILTSCYTLWGEDWKRVAQSGPHDGWERNGGFLVVMGDPKVIPSHRFQMVSDHMSILTRSTDLDLDLRSIQIK